MKAQRFIWEYRKTKNSVPMRFCCLYWALDYLFWNVPTIASITHIPTGIEVYRGYGYDYF